MITKGAVSQIVTKWSKEGYQIKIKELNNEKNVMNNIIPQKATSHCLPNLSGIFVKYQKYDLYENAIDNASG